MRERDELDRQVDDILDREERDLTRHELDAANGWEHALRAYEIASPIMSPVVGVMAEVFKTVVPRRKEQRRIDFLRQLDRAVSRLEKRLDVALGGREGFADLVEAVAERVDRRETEGKAQYYAAAVANALTPQAPSEVDQAAMIATLDALRPPHLRMLAVLRHGRINSEERPDLNALTPVLARRLPGMSTDQLEAHYADLQRHNLAPWLAQPAGAHAPSDPLALASQLTPFGRRFADWITLHES